MRVKELVKRPEVFKKSGRSQNHFYGGTKIGKVKTDNAGIKNGIRLHKGQNPAKTVDMKIARRVNKFSIDRAETYLLLE